MRRSDVPENVLVNPTPEQFLDALKVTVNRVRTDGYADLADLRITLDALKGPDGYREWSSFRLTGTSKGRQQAVSVAWWTDAKGTRYVDLTGWARVGEENVAKHFSYPFTPWAAVFTDRARSAHERRKTRLQKLLTRRCQAAPNPLVQFEGRSGWDKDEQVPCEFWHGAVMATSPDGVLIVDNRRNPKKGALILKDALDVYRLTHVPLRFVHPDRKCFRSQPSGLARVQAAVNWILAQAVKDHAA